MAKVQFEILEKYERIEVYYINSPIGNNKIVSVCFHNLTSEEYFYKELSWSDISQMQIGTVFKYGNNTGFNQTMNTYKFKDTDIERPEIVKNEDIPYGVMRYKLGNKDIIKNEYSIKFTINRKKYYLPCISMIKAIYGNYALTLNALLATDWLDQYIMSPVERNGKLIINCKESFPITLFKAEAFRYLFITLLRSDALRFWREDVYTEYQRDSLLKCLFPKNDIGGYVAEGVEQGNDILLKSIQLTNVTPPKERFIFMHPSYIEPIKDDENGNSINKPHEKSSKSKILVNSLEHPGAGNNLTLVDSVNTKWFGNAKPKIECIKSPKLVSKSNTYLINDKDNENFTTMEPRSGGTPSHRIDNKIEEDCKHEKIQVTNDFKEIINGLNYIQDIYHCKVNPDYIPIPLSIEKLRYMPDNTTRRKMMIANFNDLYGTTRYIYEVQQENISLGTLVLFEKCDSRDKVMNILNDNHGQWNSECLKNEGLKFKIIRHYKNRNAENWAKLLIQ